MVRSVLFMLCLLIAGCASPALPEDGASPSGVPVETAEGEVTVQKQGDEWVARRTETARASFSAGQDVLADTVNGAIDIDSSGSGQARVVANLWARAETEQGARNALAELSLKVTTDDGLAAVVENSGQWNKRGGSLVLRLPAGDVGQLEAETTNGAIQVGGLQADGADLSTTNGAIDAEMDVDDLDASTTNGAISIDGKAAASGTWDIHTTNGGIDLTVVEDSSRGYDVTASTTNGHINFDFDDTEEVSSSSSYVSQERHERTKGFSQRAIQTTIDMDTTNGGIDAGS